MKKNILLRTNIIICLIIVIGFITIFTINNNSNLEMLEKDIEQVSKLSSESIYSNISFMLEKPINVSTTMAHDSFLKTWLITEQEHTNPEQLQQYLLAYKEKYNYDSVFLVSTATNIYYHYNGIDRTLTRSNTEDIWYYDFLDHNTDYSLEVDNDQANHDVITVFVNCRIKDSDGNTIGVVGVGLRTEEVQKILKEYENQFNVKSFLFDINGLIQVSASETKFAYKNVFASQPYINWRTEILANKNEKMSYWYPHGEIDGYHVIQYVTNLDWYLAVIKDTQNIHEHFEIQGYQQIFFATLITLALLILVTSVIRNYNKHIVQLSDNDALTGVRNRFSYEEILKLYNKRLNRYDKLGIGVFDLNNLKNVNDSYGHNVGDIYIKNCVIIICNSFPNSAVFRIGGDEFACIFVNITEEEVKELHANMEKTFYDFNHGYIGNHSRFDRLDRGNKKFIHSVAFGYSFFDPCKDKTLNSVFARADANMYQNKKEYKDNLQQTRHRH